MQPMNEVDKEKSFTVIKITLSRKEKNHLMSLGIYEHTTITVLSNQKGNVVLETKGTKIALDKALASNIFVE